MWQCEDAELPEEEAEEEEAAEEGVAEDGMDCQEGAEAEAAVAEDAAWEVGAGGEAEAAVDDADMIVEEVAVAAEVEVVMLEEVADEGEEEVEEAAEGEDPFFVDTGAGTGQPEAAADEEDTAGAEGGEAGGAEAEGAASAATAAEAAEEEAAEEVAEELAEGAPAEGGEAEEEEGGEEDCFIIDTGEEAAAAEVPAEAEASQPAPEEAEAAVEVAEAEEAVEEEASAAAAPAAATEGAAEAEEEEEEEARGEAEDEFFLDTVGEAAEDGGAAPAAEAQPEGSEDGGATPAAEAQPEGSEAAPTEAAEAAEAAPAEAAEATEAENGDGKAFGDSVAASFSADLTEDAGEEPPAKKQKLQEALLLLPIRRRDEPAPMDVVEEVPESPMADASPGGLGLEEPEGTPPPPPSPSPTFFTPPSAKWSGAPKRAPMPSAGPEKSRLLQRVVPKLAQRAPPGLGRPLMPPMPRAQVPPLGTLAAPRGLPMKAKQPPAVSVVPKQPKQPFQPRGPMAVAPRSVGVGASPASAAPSSEASTASRASLSPDSGYVFICSNVTEREVANKKLFGSPDREMAQMRQHIRSDTQLFLLNFETLKMLGPFAPSGLPEQNIVRGAFGGRFSAQVRFVPTDGLVETQLEKKIPAGPKDSSGMQLVQKFVDKGTRPPASVLQLWSGAPGAAIAPGAPQLVLPGARGGVPAVAQVLQVRQAVTNGPRPPLGPPLALKLPVTPMMIEKYTPGKDALGRPYDLKSVVVNFANVGASYAGKVLNKDNKRGDRLFDWEGVRRCVKHLAQDLGFQVVGCVFENYWGPDNNSQQVPIPADVRKICKSIQETPCLTGKNHKSADDEMTIKCAYRRNCRFMDNDNYRDWLREMSDQRVRTWLENSQEMLQMRYFFDTDLGSFDTLDGNIPLGLLAPEARPPLLAGR